MKGCTPIVKRFSEGRHPRACIRLAPVIAYFPAESGAVSVPMAVASGQLPVSSPVRWNTPCQARRFDHPLSVNLGTAIQRRVIRHYVSGAIQRWSVRITHRSRGQTGSQSTYALVKHACQRLLGKSDPQKLREERAVDGYKMKGGRTLGKAHL